MSNQSYTRADAFDAGWPLAMGNPSQPRTYIADLDRLHRGHGHIRIGMHWPWKMVNVVVRLHYSKFQSRHLPTVSVSKCMPR